MLVQQRLGLRLSSTQQAALRCPDRRLHPSPAKFASATCFMCSSDNVVMYCPRRSLDIRSGFSQRTMLSLRSPLSAALMITCVGWFVFLSELVSGSAMMLGLLAFPCCSGRRRPDANHSVRCHCHRTSSNTLHQSAEPALCYSENPIC